MSAIGNAAKRGVLIKGGVHLETLGRINAIAFDKTGTLTKGEPFVTDIVMMDGADETDVYRIVYSLEKDTTHPLAKALTIKAGIISTQPPLYRLKPLRLYLVAG